MAHWAELDENNVVIRVTVGDNNDPAGDEGYQWLLNNLTLPTLALPMIQYVMLLLDLSQQMTGFLMKIPVNG
jgi:hypothetical protein